MKKIQILFSLVALVVVVYGCKKIIHLDLKDADKKFVIQGTITNSGFPDTIFISKTMSFDDENRFTGVPGAVVTLSDNLGNSEILIAEDSGIYVTQSILGIEGRTYSLKVEIGNNIFTASSSMPQQVPLDTVYTIDRVFFGEMIKECVPEYRDPAGIKNYYYIKLYHNNKYIDHMLRNNNFTDGKKNVSGMVVGDPDIVINPKDTLSFVMQCIDENSYTYWFSYFQGSGGGSLPANPVTNIKGGALGYFSANTIQIKSMIVK